MGLQLIGGLADITKDNHQPISNELQAQYKDYQSKFANILGRQQ